MFFTIIRINYTKAYVFLYFYNLLKKTFVLNKNKE